MDIDRCHGHCRTCSKHLTADVLQMEEETDELLLADDDAYDVDPDQLPHRILTDFSVYNNEV